MTLVSDRAESIDTYLRRVQKELAHVPADDLWVWLEDKFRTVAVRARSAEQRRCLDWVERRISDDRGASHNEVLVSLATDIRGNQWAAT